MDISPVRFAAEFYDDTVFAHCQRVADYINENAPCYIRGSFTSPNAISVENIRDDLTAVAWLHDIYEDTCCPHFFEGDIEKALNLLTHDKIKNTYNDYLKKIREASKTSYHGQLAYWVKIADMKDHLSQADTLTPKLKEKYLSGLAVLL